MPRTRRRARLASFLDAAGVRPTIGAISSNGIPKPEPVRETYRNEWVPAYKALDRWNEDLWNAPA